MEHLFGLFTRMLVLSTAMSVSSFVCGLIPLSIQLSPLYLRHISLLSMGLLLSTSLVIIIPEGVASVFKTSNKDDAPLLIGVLLLSGFLLMYIIDHVHLIKDLISHNVKYTGMESDIEQQQQQQVPTNVDPLRNNVWQKYFAGPFQRIVKPLTKSSITLGLVIHSITDGVVLTSSIFSSNESLNLIMFVAIFIHKLPTGFSLVSILIAEGYQKSEVKLHLFIFSSSLMIGSISSFVVFQLLTGTDRSKLEPNIAYLLMLSGGTFLYIGVHTMIEILGDNNKEVLSSSSSSSSPPRSSSSDETIVVPQRGEASISPVEFAITIVGFLLPLIALFFKE